MAATLSGAPTSGVDRYCRIFIAAVGANPIDFHSSISPCTASRRISVQVCSGLPYSPSTRCSVFLSFLAAVRLVMARRIEVSGTRTRLSRSRTCDGEYRMPRCRWKEIFRTIHPHPTLPEAIMQAAEAVYGHAIDA